MCNSFHADLKNQGKPADPAGEFLSILLGGQQEHIVLIEFLVSRVFINCAHIYPANCIRHGDKCSGFDGGHLVAFPRSVVLSTCMPYINYLGALSDPPPNRRYDDG